VNSTRLFAGGINGTVYGINRSSGHVDWSMPAGAKVTEFSITGRGDTVYVPTMNDGYAALATDSGAVRWEAPGCRFGAAVATPISGDDLIVGLEAHRDGQTLTLQGYALDSCGQTKFLRPGLGFSTAIIDRNYRLNYVSGVVPSQQALDRAGLDQGDIQGSALIGQAGDYSYVIAVGADDVVYVYSCVGVSSGSPQSRIIALRSGVTVQNAGNVSIGTGCDLEFGSGGALDSNGVLYVASGDSLVAVQTTSPGPANAAWPLIYHDSQGTAFK
jgi:hypothetical protein